MWPTAVAFVGDLLDSNGSGPGMAGLEECAELMAHLQKPDLIFVRGNHEEDNWPAFASMLCGKEREIFTLHGECHRVGATGLTGFPCVEGKEVPMSRTRFKSNSCTNRTPSATTGHVLALAQELILHGGISLAREPAAAPPDAEPS